MELPVCITFSVPHPETLPTSGVFYQLFYLLVSHSQMWRRREFLAYNKTSLLRPLFSLYPPSAPKQQIPLQVQGEEEAAGLCLYGYANGFMHIKMINFSQSSKDICWIGGTVLGWRYLVTDRNLHDLTFTVGKWRGLFSWCEIQNGKESWRQWGSQRSHGSRHTFNGQWQIPV